VISGKVDPRRRCLVLLEIRVPEGQSEIIEFQVDTGFSGSLLLPLDIVLRLG
jgi:predicted aspartyl protease